METAAKKELEYIIDCHLENEKGSWITCGDPCYGIPTVEDIECWIDDFASEEDKAEANHILKERLKKGKK